MSGQQTGSELDLRAVVDPTKAKDSGVAHAEALIEFSDALVGDDDAALERARARVAHELGPAALVDVAGVASNFERMVRIADSTGIPLDPPLNTMSQDVRHDLELTRYASAANTEQPSWLVRLAGPVVRPLVLRGMQLLSKRGRG